SCAGACPVTACGASATPPAAAALFSIFRRESAMRAGYHLCDLRDEFLRRNRPPEVGLDVEQRRFLHRRRTRRHHSIGNQDRPVVQYEPMTKRSLDADIGRDAGEEQVPDATRL